MLPATDAIDLGRDLTDDDLLARIRRGDLRYFEALMRRHNRRVFRVARAVVADDAEAEDVMQEAYVRAYAALTGFEGRSTFATWIARIAVNEALGRARRTRFRLLVRGRDSGCRPPPPLDPEAGAERTELRAILTAAIDALPDGLRRAFVLREVEQLSGAETAEILGISEDAVKVRLHRARCLLRDTISDELGEDVKSLYGFHLDRCDRVVWGALERLADRLVERALALAAS
jgi:RNA polymerase sigma-70 factor (ECF subfamily)